MASRIKGRPLALRDLRPGLPTSLVEVVERLMANRPDDRYSTATAAAEALQVCGECEQFLSQSGAHDSRCEGTGNFGALSAERSIPGEVSRTNSTNAGLAPMGWWLGLLWYLSGWSQRIALLVLSAAFVTGSAALAAAFAAGIAIGSAPH